MTAPSLSRHYKSLFFPDYYGKSNDWHRFAHKSRGLTHRRSCEPTSRRIGSAGTRARVSRPTGRGRPAFRPAGSATDRADACHRFRALHHGSTDRKRLHDLSIEPDLDQASFGELVEE